MQSNVWDGSKDLDGQKTFLDPEKKLGMKYYPSLYFLNFVDFNDFDPLIIQ